MFLTWKMTGNDEWIPYFMIEPFSIDILQFAGLTFIFFEIIRKLKLTILKAQEELSQ